MIAQGYEHKADSWIAWARTPGHDSYWSYRDSFFTEIVPPPQEAAFEIGCGEGRVTRDLHERGHNAVGLDASPSLIAAAKVSDPDGEYIVGEAKALPFSDGSFDLVVFYNVLMDLDEMPRAVLEASRVLRPSGRVAVCVTHPFTDAGRWKPDRSAFVVEGSYLDEKPYRDLFQRDGLSFLFEGKTVPLESYARAFPAAGLLIDRIREPKPPPIIAAASASHACRCSST